MAARRTRVNPQAVRDKIKAQRLVRQLHKHIDGKAVLTMAQVRAIDILLRKIVPDLTQANVTGEVTQKYVVEVPPLLTKDEWLKRYKTPQAGIEHKPERPTPPTIDATPLLPLPPPLKP
jgi:hypothetical protein